MTATSFLDVAEAETALAEELAAIMRTAKDTIMHSAAAEAALVEAAIRQDGIAETWRFAARTYSEHGDVATRAIAASILLAPSEATPAFSSGAQHAASAVLHTLQVTSA